MSRSHNEFRKESYFMRRGVHKTNYEGCIRETGLSIFRPVNPDQLYCISSIIDSKPYITVARNRDSEKGHAISMLELVETRRNYEEIGSLITSEVIKQIYDQVPSLRRTVQVTASRLTILGNFKDAQKPVCIVFDDDSANKLAQERGNIFTILEENTATEGYQLKTSYREKIPHISICRIPTDYDLQARNTLLRVLESNLPESINVKPATFYMPR